MSAAHLDKAARALEKRLRRMRGDRRERERIRAAIATLEHLIAIQRHLERRPA